jgi:hypothetical protein
VLTDLCLTPMLTDLCLTPVLTDLCLTLYNYIPNGNTLHGCQDIQQSSSVYKDVSNKDRDFESCLKRFLHTRSFYSLDENFQHKSSANLT